MKRKVSVSESCLVDTCSDLVFQIDVYCAPLAFALWSYRRLLADRYHYLTPCNLSISSFQSSIMDGGTMTSVSLSPRFLLHRRTPWVAHTHMVLCLRIYSCHAVISVNEHAAFVIVSCTPPLHWEFAIDIVSCTQDRQFSAMVLWYQRRQFSSHCSIPWRRLDKCDEGKWLRLHRVEKWGLSFRSRWRTRS